MTVDPLSEIVTLLQPSAGLSKQVEYTGSWRIRRDPESKPVYFAVLEGGCRVVGPGRSPILLRAGDFVLSPSANEQTIESIDAPPEGAYVLPVEIGEGRFRVGPPTEPVNLRMQYGLCRFASPDAALLVSLLPSLVVARGEPRLEQLLQLVSDETRQFRPGRDLVLERLLEVLMIEALRCGTEMASVPSLARGLSDVRLAPALRAVHARPDSDWTVTKLAIEAGMSRSAFFARFGRIVGLAPMEYVLAWRMALAKRLLRAHDLATERIATQVGYSSASTFTTAFTRHVGMTPLRYARSTDIP
ncbi:transcriptional regulator AraC family (plasmid) [Cupriavidus necator N-1]|uniref:Transcriptional regulator AraC family n=1 Tax=Cupriavidus necator (strain ATCC 43291 / DSM 13513 / CCUG 52238 / LMG 8453 / N-1) TaxID=1042878 RepID=F8GX53_CUPNN|nr:AraC family transcriptional regulator [Cupriavidus necator]AEI81923.1 transcriptional regulator AraC family [Cupriavidus necator N-1]MDX6008245.1 AraC family transcriptional regulator [Cupriavidus necator]